MLGASGSTGPHAAGSRVGAERRGVARRPEWGRVLQLARTWPHSHGRRPGPAHRLPAARQPRSLPGDAEPAPACLPAARGSPGALRVQMSPALPSRDGGVGLSLARTDARPASGQAQQRAPARSDRAASPRAPPPRQGLLVSATLPAEAHRRGELVSLGARRRSGRGGLRRPRRACANAK